MSTADKMTFTEKSFLAMVISAMITVVIYCFSTGISGNDYWWHIKVGEWIWEYKSIPRTDIFSWYGVEHGFEFTAHEWLADVFFYGVQRAFGQAGIFVFSLLAALALIFLILKTTIKRIFRNAVFSALFFVLLAVVSTVFFYGRPHIFSFYLFFIELSCLYAFVRNPGSKGIMLVPLLGCLWSNLHGGSSNLSYLLCLVFLFCGVVKFDLNKLYSQRLGIRQIRTLCIVTVLTAAAVLVNPIGFDVWVYPYVNIADSFMLSVISEWAAPDAKNIGEVILYFVPVFMVFGSLMITDKKIRLIDFVLLMLFTFLFLRSIRFSIFFYIAASFFAFEYFPQWSLKEIKGRIEKVTVLLFFVLIGAGVFLNAVKTVALAAEGNLIAKALKDPMVEVVRQEDPKRIFNDYNFGETLIYNDLPVFFDSRADVYGAGGTLKDGVSLLFLQSAEGEPGFDFDALIEKYQFDGFLISVSRPLYTYLMSHEEKYRLVYSDDVAGYFSVISQ